MAKIVIKSRVGADGVLHFDLPLGSPEAGREVQVTVESAPSGAMTRAEWAAFLDRTAGAWQGEFKRPPQGELEVRDPL